ncbi:hypothetical protein WJX77_003631 [Trebouxia sp. C0004]
MATPRSSSAEPAAFSVTVSDITSSPVDERGMQRVNSTTPFNQLMQAGSGLGKESPERAGTWHSDEHELDDPKAKDNVAGEDALT